ncbi:MAG: hypothetical protein CVU67_01095, partial [Deltaproteobacteria bacterium HGW-Deltaproteobacteria-24]
MKSLKPNDVTPEELFNNRRKFLKLGAAGLVANTALLELLAKENLPVSNLLYSKDANPNNLTLNSFEQITSYNNFYEFTTSKEGVKGLAHTLKPKPWSITIDGLVEKPFEIDVEELIKKYSLQERIYRFRCVEGWSMVVPWIGFELNQLIKDAKVLSKAKYGYRIVEDEMELNLLRSPADVDPTADQHQHTYEYAFYPHRGSFEDSRVLQMAHCYAYPLEVMLGGKTAPSLEQIGIKLEATAVKLDTIKPAYGRDGIV